MNPSRRRNPALRFAKRFFTVVLIVPTLGLAAALLAAPILWVGDMLTFFTPWIGVGALVLLFATLILRLRLVALSAIVLGAVVFVPMALVWQQAPAAVDGMALRITTFNTLGGTANPDRLLEFLAAESPDILVLEEYSSGLDDDLAGPLAQMFGYRSDAGEGNVPAVVVLSRFPIVESETIPPPGRSFGQGIARARIATDAGVVVVYGVHTTTPRHGERDWRARNEMLATLADNIALEAEGIPVVAAGDFNTPPWSPFYRDLLAAAALTTTEGAFLPAATRIVDRGWLPDMFGSPVDHILVSEGVGWQPARIGPDLDSDHRPVTVDLTLR